MSLLSYENTVYIDSLLGQLWLWNILLQTWVFSGITLDLDNIASLIDETN